MTGYTLNKNCIILSLDRNSFLCLDEQENNYKRNISSSLNKTSIFYSCLLFDVKELNELKNEIKNVLFNFSHWNQPFVAPSDGIEWSLSWFYVIQVFIEIIHSIDEKEKNLALFVDRINSKGYLLSFNFDFLTTFLPWILIFRNENNCIVEI
jgi:hypothetical protein